MHELPAVIGAIRLRHHTLFRLTDNEKESIKSAIQTLINQGVFTKTPVRDKHWLSSRLISRMIMELFKKAIRDRVSDWCTVINASLGFALLTALGCRAGDIAKST